MRKTLVDYILDEDYERYNELLNKAEAAKAEYKATHKTERAPRAPMTAEQKRAAAEKRLQKLQDKLDAMLAANGD